MLPEVFWGFVTTKNLLLSQTNIATPRTHWVDNDLFLPLPRPCLRWAFVDLFWKRQRCSVVWEEQRPEPRGQAGQGGNMSSVKSGQVTSFFFYCHGSPVYLMGGGVNHQFHQDTIQHWFLRQSYDISWYHSDTLYNSGVNFRSIILSWVRFTCINAQKTHQFSPVPLK